MNSLFESINDKLEEGYNDGRFAIQTSDGAHYSGSKAFSSGGISNAADCVYGAYTPMFTFENDYAVYDSYESARSTLEAVKEYYAFDVIQTAYVVDSSGNKVEDKKAE